MIIAHRLAFTPYLPTQFYLLLWELVPEFLSFNALWSCCQLTWKVLKQLARFQLCFIHPWCQIAPAEKLMEMLCLDDFVHRKGKVHFSRNPLKMLQCQPLFSLTTYMHIFGNLNPTHRSIHLLSGSGRVPPKWTMFRPPWWLPQQPLPTTTINTNSMTSNSFPPRPGTSSRKLSNAQAFAKMVWPVCKKVSSNIIKCSCYYRTRVRSLAMLVTNSLTHSLTHSLTPI